jgi:hypothetical protein
MVFNLEKCLQIRKDFLFSKPPWIETQLTPKLAQPAPSFLYFSHGPVQLGVAQVMAQPPELPWASTSCPCATVCRHPPLLCLSMLRCQSSHEPWTPCLSHGCARHHLAPSLIHIRSGFPPFRIQARLIYLWINSVRNRSRSPCTSRRTFSPI